MLDKKVVLGDKERKALTNQMMSVFPITGLTLHLGGVVAAFLFLLNPPFLPLSLKNIGVLQLILRGWVAKW